MTQDCKDNLVIQMFYTMEDMQEGRYVTYYLKIIMSHGSFCREGAVFYTIVYILYLMYFVWQNQL